MGLLKRAAAGMKVNRSPKENKASGHDELDASMAPWVRMCPKVDSDGNHLPTVERAALQRLVTHLLANPGDSCCSRVPKRGQGGQLEINTQAMLNDSCGTLGLSRVHRRPQHVVSQPRWKCVLRDIVVAPADNTHHRTS